MFGTRNHEIYTYYFCDVLKTENRLRAICCADIHLSYVVLAHHGCHSYQYNWLLVLLHFHDSNIHHDS